MKKRIEVKSKQEAWDEYEEKLPVIPSKEDIKKAASNQYTFEPEQVQLVKVFVMGYEFESEANKAVYKAMNENEQSGKNLIAGEMVVAYCEDKGIEWGTIQVIDIRQYNNAVDGGHFVIEAIVSPRVKRNRKN